MAAIFALASTALPQCDISVGKAEQAPQWNEFFTRNGPGWTGADTTVSVQLPNGDSAFFFSDSFIAEDPAKPGDGTVYTNENGLRLRRPNCLPPFCGAAPEHAHYVFNSIVVR